MCTVSYIPTKDGVVITSNRDEHISRSTNLSPREKKINGQKILFPEDARAGGSWFAINESGGAVVLLNGAFENHKRTPPYAMSRGLIVLEVVAQQETIPYLEGVALKNIEPFTLVLYNGPDLWEFRWDGKKKYFSERDRSQAYIWSSATLYDKTAIHVRERLFSEFLVSGEGITAASTIGFHQNNHGDFENGFVIDRKNGLKTLSITQAVFGQQQITMNHLDLSLEKKASAFLEKVPPLETLP